MREKTFQRGLTELQIESGHPVGMVLVQPEIWVYDLELKSLGLGRKTWEALAELAGEAMKIDGTS